MCACCSTHGMGADLFSLFTRSPVIAAAMHIVEYIPNLQAFSGLSDSHITQNFEKIEESSFKFPMIYKKCGSIPDLIITTFTWSKFLGSNLKSNLEFGPYNDCVPIWGPQVKI